MCGEPVRRPHRCRGVDDDDDCSCSFCSSAQAAAPCLLPLSLATLRDTAPVDLSLHLTAAFCNPQYCALRSNINSQQLSSAILFSSLSALYPIVSPTTPVHDPLATRQLHFIRGTALSATASSSGSHLATRTLTSPHLHCDPNQIPISGSDSVHSSGRSGPRSLPVRGRIP